MKTLPLVSLLDDVEAPAPDQDKAGLGALQTGRGLLPLEAVALDATLDGLTAHLRLTQTFVNVHAEHLEATYIFPLPERAAVVRFRLQVGDRLIEGELKERGQARKEYREAIRQGHQAAITEEERPGTFTMRVGNIPPGERATVHLELAQPLPCVEGEATFRFPLVVAPRYIPGTPLGRPATGTGTVRDTDAVPDASRISPPVLLPGFLNPVALSLAVTFLPSDASPFVVRSSLHTVVEEQAGDGFRLRVLAGERLNRDFVLRFRLADAAIRTALSLHPDPDGTGGTFALTVLPPLLEGASRPRDVVFVLDRSGSMRGWKMVTARRAVMRLVETLGDRDRFAVYAFDNAIDTPPSFPGDRLVPATFTNRTAALEFLGGVNDRGGTEMARPLDLALARLLENGCDGERERVLVLITDGQVGNESQILKQMGPRLKHVRVHALGIDRAVNAGFLQQLADLGGGSSTLVESEARLEAVVDQVQRRIGTPVLTGLKIQTDGLRIDRESLVPARLPDLFTGVPVVILGRYEGAGDGGLTLSGTGADGRVWSVRVPAKCQAQPALPALWARQRLRDLEDRYVIASSKELEREIVALSLRHGVLCRFTSFVAVDRSRVVNAGGKQHAVTQAVELPDGWAGRREERAPGGVVLAAAADMEAEESDDAGPASSRLSFHQRSRKAPAPRKKERAMPQAREKKTDRKPESPAAAFLAGLGRVATLVRDGLKALLALGHTLSANPIDRTVFASEVDALLAVFAGATTHPARLGVLESTLPRLLALLQSLAAAGDFSAEMLHLCGTTQTLSELAAQGVPEEPALAPAWTDVREALASYRELIEAESFWK